MLDDIKRLKSLLNEKHTLLRRLNRLNNFIELTIKRIEKSYEPITKLEHFTDTGILLNFDNGNSLLLLPSKEYIELVYMVFKND